MNLKDLKLALNGHDENLNTYVLGPDGVDYEIFHVEKDSDKLMIAIRKIVNPLDPMQDTIRATIKSLVTSSDLSIIEKPVIAAALSDYFMLHPSTTPMDRLTALTLLTSGLHGEQLAEEIFNRVYRKDAY